jgi:hypothetical protein
MIGIGSEREEQLVFRHHAGMTLISIMLPFVSGERNQAAVAGEAKRATSLHLARISHRGHLVPEARSTSCVQFGSETVGRGAEHPLSAQLQAELPASCACSARLVLRSGTEVRACDYPNWPFP